MKFRILFSAIVLFAGTAAAQSFQVDSTSEWEGDGSGSNVNVENGLLMLENEGVTKDWQNKPPSYFPTKSLNDVEKASGETAIYTAGSPAHVYTVAKWDYNGNKVWDRDLGGWEVDKIEVTSNYVYAVSPSEDVIKRLDKSDGSTVDKYQVGSRPRNLEINNGKLFVIADDDNVKRFDLSDPNNIEEQYSFGSTIRAVDADSSGNVYVGSQSGIHKFDSDLNFQQKRDMGRVQEIEVGPDGFLHVTKFAGNSPSVYKMDSDFNDEPGWPIEPNTSVQDNPGDIDVGPDGYVYISTLYDDDATYKFDEDGNKIWRYQDPESQLGVEYYDKGAISAGKYENSGTGPGVLTKFFETYYNPGSYASNSFGDGSNKYWTAVEIDTNLNGESGTITARISDDPGMSSVIATESASLSNGLTKLNFNGQEAEYIDFQIDLTTSGDRTDTPEVNYVALNYQNTPLNTAPAFSSEMPNDGSNIDSEDPLLSVDVDDADGDSFDWEIRDDSGAVLESGTFSGSGTASEPYTGLTPGNTYNWEIWADDGSLTNSETYSFTVNDNQPTISNPDPSDGGNINSGAYTVSADIFEPEGQSVDWRIEDGSGNVLNSSTLSSGTGTVQARWTGIPPGSYSWTVFADDGANTVSQTYSFDRANNPVEITNPNPSDGSSVNTGSVRVKAELNDPNNQNVDWEIRDGAGNVLNSSTFSSGSGTVAATLTGVSGGNSYTWTVEAQDPQSTSTETYTFSRTNSIPTISNPIPPNQSQVGYSDVDVSIDVEEIDGNTYDVKITNSTGDTILSQSGLTGSNTLTKDYNGLRSSNTYSWTVTVDDGNTLVSEYYEFDFELIDTSAELISKFQTNYSSVLASRSNQEIVPFIVRTESGSRDVTVSIDDAQSDVDADILNYPGGRDLTVDSNGATILIAVDPTTNGDKTLVVNVEDRTLGISKQETINVRVRDTPPEFQRNSIPGLGFIELLFLLFMSSLAYSALL